MDALERIEVAVRASLSHEISMRHGTHWFMDAVPFVPNYDHANFLEHVKKEIGHDPARAHARQVFIQHYYDKYREPELPPSWMVFEVLSFGTVSQVFKKLKRENQKPVAKVFGLDGGVLASWLHTINACGAGLSPSSRFPPNATPTINQDVWDIDKKIESIATQNQVEYISARKILCNFNGCLAIMNGKEPTTFDSGHLSPPASKLVANSLMAEIFK